MAYKRDELLKIVKEENVSYIRLQFSDMLGTIKCVEIPSSKLKDALDNKIMFDGSSIEGFVRIKEADMYLHPDLDSFLILSFEDLRYGKVARLICDVYDPSGNPFQGDPRYILKRQIEKMHELGISDFQVGFEPEFYLFKNDENGNCNMEVSDRGSYFDMSPIDGANECRREIALELEKLGFEIELSHHEVGPGQQEINFKYGSALETCDRIQTFKQIVKNIARKHNLTATFMPKPVYKLAGNGMHTNCSLWDKDGNNIFFDENDPMQLSDVARRFMSGILNHARALAAICNPTVNSYKRLVLGYEAPVYACWSDANRSSMIRIPAARGKATRTEVRNVDPMANPYLALACILAAGLEGIKDNVEIIPPVYDNIFELTREEREEKGIKNLPENLKDAIKELKRDKLLREVLGEHTYKKYVLAKELEWEEYRVLVTPWELSKYL
ncbi:MAG: type I glutamate--ammonia ligase [Erysipelotrichales bacterium]|nr:type I glutamate--ammonia ligase [Erysipelotrichales bacterium]